MWLERAAILPLLQAYIVQLLASPTAVKMAFILDSTAVPEIITLTQVYGLAVLDIVLYLTRSYVYGLHRKKLGHMQSIIQFSLILILPVLIFLLQVP